MTRTSGDLHVVYDQLVPGGPEMRFCAERLADLGSEPWVLYLSTDQVSCELTRVIPQTLGHSIDTHGVLGLIFDAPVRSVQLTVRTSATRRVQQWRFWLDEVAGIV